MRGAAQRCVSGDICDSAITHPVLGRRSLNSLLERATLSVATMRGVRVLAEGRRSDRG
jgi:hypothetical protein